jgi:H+/gluconate symporter-like permease
VPALIVATPGLLDAKVTTRPVSTLPLASFVTAVKAGVDEPSTTDCVVGEIVTLATGIAETVRVAALLVFPSLEAVIDVVPGDCPVATPVLALIVATLVLLDAKVTTRPVSTLPLASFVTAVKAGVDEPSTTD